MNGLFDRIGSTAGRLVFEKGSGCFPARAREP